MSVISPYVWCLTDRIVVVQSWTHLSVRQPDFIVFLFRALSTGTSPTFFLTYISRLWLPVQNYYPPSTINFILRTCVLIGYLLLRIRSMVLKSTNSTCYVLWVYVIDVPVSSWYIVHLLTAQITECSPKQVLLSTSLFPSLFLWFYFFLLLFILIILYSSL